MADLKRHVLICLSNDLLPVCATDDMSYVDGFRIGQIGGRQRLPTIYKYSIGDRIHLFSFHLSRQRPCANALRFLETGLN